MPTESACCLPSAITVTIELAIKSGLIMAPLEVNPGHIMLAPDKTKVIAPLSTCIKGQINGSVCETLNFNKQTNNLEAITFMNQL